MIIVGSVIGILLVVGTIILYRTYAFFEEKKEFNVIKGQIPEFSQEDVQLSWYIGSEKQTDPFPKKDNGYVGVSVTCEHEATAEWSNAIWGLVNINPNNQKKVYCSVTFESGNTIADNDLKAEDIRCGTSKFGVNGILGCNGNETGYDTRIKLGDLISLTPTLNEFTISSSLTGYEQDQIIHPNYNKIWRVIKIYKDGRIDVISEYTSNENIYFTGKTGYQNYVGTLNTIASAYSVTGYTIGARHIGYNGQTEYLADTATAITTTGNTAPFNTTTDNTNETQGGGDIKYQYDTGSDGNSTDYGSEEGLIYQVYNAKRGSEPKPLLAYKTNPDGTGSTTEAQYWLASRKFEKLGDYWRINARDVYANGSMNDYDLWYSTGGDLSRSNAIRAILTLKSGLSIKSGSGTIDTPWILN